MAGDDMGWTVGPDYQAWARGKVFRIGDLLECSKYLIRYPKGAYNVHQVDELAAFVQCAPLSTSVPLTSGNDVIALNKTRDNYFICGIGSHCATGNLKLMITVFPQGSTTLPNNTPQFSAAGFTRFDYLAWTIAACAVATSAMAVDLAKDHDKDWFIARDLDFVVGDDKCWTIGLDYQAWAKPKEFHVGDRLVFNYLNGEHSVYQVKETAFKQCVPSAGSTTLTTGNDIVTLTAMRTYFFLCSIGQHCKAENQKLAITVLPGVPGSPPSNIHIISAASFARFNYLAWMIVACIAFKMIRVPIRPHGVREILSHVEPA
ncbi:hypothetical protein RJ640_028693 [Escallonia rubra]|uniref:Phytocyanin domain-containing protein n=1 Tax=Escallonia rubra TaxID=112253 RepID=A0AA88UQT0_9ASTE|nr:hypothetical protein RJ640_028693 [Escallonia rubra]